MRAWGCITANGNILPRSIRASEGEAYQVAQAEPQAAWVVKLHVAIDQRWMAQKRRAMLAAQARSMMRRAFAARGHDVWSCDLLPAEDGSNRHITGDVRDYLSDGWDLLAVMHPPCTRLCNSGVRWLHTPPPGRSLADMWAELDEGAALFTACWQAPIDRVAVENPVMHKHARARLPDDLPKPQIVQPWWFGEPFFKATGFYLRGLPALDPTHRLTPPRPGTDAHKKWSAVHRAPPGPDRWKFRSRTFEGVAEACADQWSQPDLVQMMEAAE